MKLEIFFNVSLVILTGFLLSRYLKPLVSLLINKISKKFPEQIRECLLSQSKAPYSLFIFYIVCTLGFSFISVEEKWLTFLLGPLKIILTYGLVLFIWQFLDILEQMIILQVREDNPENTMSTDTIKKHFLPYSKKILKILVFLLAVLLALQNSGFNVTSLIASLGIGGIALALASKDTLSNFFGGISVVADKPFSVGDWIICKDFEGTVEDIGFRSTKIKTFYDSILTIPNSLISENIIDNLGRRRARRTRFTLDITYDTPPEKIEAFVEGLKNIIQSNACTRKDYYQCYFSAYGHYSLQILLNFFLKVKDWDSELLQKQNIFLEILRLAKELEVDFAFPTQTLEVPSLLVQEGTKKKLGSIEELKKTALSFGPKGSLSRPQGLGISKSKKD